VTTIGVLGASGVYGRALVPRLVAAGHTVRALVRRPEAATAAVACGADVGRADIFDPQSLRAALDGCEIGVNLATSLPGPKGRGGDFAANDQLQRLGTPIWVKACQDAGVARILQQSIALVSSGVGDEWTDEDTTFAPDDTTAGRAIGACLAMEAAVRGSALDWLVLRGGLFYRPGTGYDDAWFAAARAGQLRLPGDGSSYVSLVHIADMAQATVQAISHWPSEQILIVADDAPARWRDVLGEVAALAGAAPPQPGGRIGRPPAACATAALARPWDGRLSIPATASAWRADCRGLQAGRSRHRAAMPPGLLMTCLRIITAGRAAEAQKAGRQVSPDQQPPHTGTKYYRLNRI
jgi:nucleoside-diphosphate-sugar epimerase